jgi:DNA-binding response OmpR family regulator
MAKQQILLVDSDSSSARLLEVSLRSAGFTVAVSPSAESALDKLEHGVPDLILTDTRLPGADGFAFVRKLRARAELAEVPVVFLTEHGALDEKLRGLELGVDDYLAKPIMVREVVTRVQLLLARKKQHRIATEPQARTRFSGSLEDVAVVDLLQTIAVSGKSGVASVKRGEREALLYFERGQIIDAEVGDLTGEEAVYRTLTWTTGVFDLEFRAIERPRVIELPQPVLLMEGLRRVDELGRLAEQLPPENAVVDIDHDALVSRLNEIPDELNGILRLIDGKRTLVDLIDASPFDDLSTLTVLSKFYFEGLLRSHNQEPVEWAPGSRAAAATSGEGPASDAGPEAAAPTVPSVRPLPLARPEYAAPSEPPRESQRLTPAPVTARAAVDQDVKLTPKGIVNVGDTPSSSKAVPSPFRTDHDAPRRSPIPMPAGSTPRANGTSSQAWSHGSDSPHTNGVRTSRTAHGLSAAFVRESPVDRPASAASRASPVPDPSASRPSGVADAPREPSTPRRADDTQPVGVSSVSQHSPYDAPTRPAPPPSSPLPGAPPKPPASVASEPAGSAPGSNPESEQEFFEAGDHGTYAGGPRSDMPVLDREPEAPSARPERAKPFHRSVGRRTLVVTGVLVLVAVPLLVAAWRHLAAQRHAGVAPEPSSAAPAQFAPDAVNQPGNTGDSVASSATAVAPASDAPALEGDAATPMVPDGSMPTLQAAAPLTPPPPASPSAPRLPESRASSATRPAAPRPAARPSGTPSPSPAPANPAETPFIPPFEAPPPKAEPRPGEKPPTAAFPLE